VSMIRDGIIEFAHGCIANVKDQTFCSCRCNHTFALVSCCWVKSFTYQQISAKNPESSQSALHQHHIKIISGLSIQQILAHPSCTIWLNFSHLCDQTLPTHMHILCAATYMLFVKLCVRQRVAIPICGGKGADGTQANRQG
jgi:hypothetical protein